MFHTPSAHYDATAKLLHWLMALMIFGLLGLGFYMQGLPLSPQKLQFYSWHKWAGVTVFSWRCCAWSGGPPTNRRPCLAT